MESGSVLAAELYQKVTQEVLQEFICNVVVARVYLQCSVERTFNCNSGVLQEFICSVVLKELSTAIVVLQEFICSVVLHENFSAVCVVLQSEATPPFGRPLPADFVHDTFT